MKKALFITDSFDEIYSPELQRRVEAMVEIIAPPQSREIARHTPELLTDVEIVMSGWYGPRLDRDFLTSAPNLEAFFYAGGSTRHLIDPVVWERGITVCSSIHANSIPVAEYTMAQIILCLKQVYQATNTYRQDLAQNYPMQQVVGAYGGTIGLVGVGNVARLLIGLLKHVDVRVLAYDPEVSADVMRDLGVKSVSLETVFAESDVVSLHASAIPSTEGMITGHLVKSMKRGASLINTARGSLIREGEMLNVLRARPDLYAILDVTDPEPPAPRSELWTLPNVLLTPHVSGSHGAERFRVGCMMVDELERYLRGQPLEWRVQAPAHEKENAML